MSFKLKVLALTVLAMPLFLFGDKADQEQRLENSGTVMKQILDVPDDIPQDLLNKAECVIVYPSVKKFAIGIGGSYGRGAMVCRTGPDFKGKWGAPSMMRLEGGSFGLQLGGSATDFVLLVMNPKGANSILSSKVKLGGNASAAAGPKGRTTSAETDAAMQAEILSYSRSQGLFAGVSLEGSTVRPDNDGNKDLYGEKLSAKEIVLQNKVPVPKAAEGMVQLLDQKSPKNLSK